MPIKPPAVFDFPAIAAARSMARGDIPTGRKFEFIDDAFGPVRSSEPDMETDNGWVEAAAPVGLTKEARKHEKLKQAGLIQEEPVENPDSYWFASSPLAIYQADYLRSNSYIFYNYKNVPVEINEVGNWRVAESIPEEKILCNLPNNPHYVVSCSDQSQPWYVRAPDGRCLRVPCDGRAYRLSREYYPPEYSTKEYFLIPVE